MITTLHDLIIGATEDLQERMTELGCQSSDENDVSDLIHEVADSWVPIYYSQLIEVASHNLWVATSEPELWPAFDGSPTPVNIIATNIYESIIEALREQVNGHEELQQQVE